MDLTTLARIKVKRGISGTSNDALIALLITEVSQEASDYLRRYVQTATFTEVWPLVVGRRYVTLYGMPASAVTSVKYSPNLDFSSVTALGTDMYNVDLARAQIYIHGFDSWYPAGFIQVVYTGGMSADTPAFIAAYPRIAGAVDNEVINRANRIDQPDGNVSTSIGGSRTFTGQIGPLSDFHRALDYHRRIILG